MKAIRLSLLWVLLGLLLVQQYITNRALQAVNRISAEESELIKADAELKANDKILEDADAALKQRADELQAADERLQTACTR